MTRKRFVFRLRTYFLVIALGAAAVGIGLQQRRIHELQQQFNEIQIEHEALKQLMVEQPPVRTIPLALL